MTDRPGAVSPDTQKDAEMAIDFQREARLDREAREERERERERRTAPRPHVPVAALVPLASAIEQNLPEEPVGEGETIAHAARQGFAQGFSDELSPASPIGALAQVAEAAESGIAGAPSEHLERFPELQGVEVNTGVASRFPELGETERPALDTDLEDDVFDRGRR